MPIPGPTARPAPSRRPFAALAFGFGLALAAPAGAGEPATEPGLLDRDTLTGDWGGLRSRLAEAGVAVGLRYTGEVFGEVSGGLRQGVVYDDQFLLTADVDFGRLVGLDGLTAHASALSLHGRGPAFNLSGSATDPSNVEYLGRNQRYSRLWTAWLQQEFADGAVSLRAGQLSADDEFLLAPTASIFMNSTFVWNALAVANLPAGLPNGQNLTNGAGYPLGAPGVRLQVSPSENWAWLTAVLSHQPESADRGGAQFKVRDAFVISELQFLRNQGKDATGLPGMVKLGGWYDNARFTDLANDAAGAPPRSRRGEATIYAVVDQTLWRAADGDQAVSVFLRGHVAPDDDINQVGWYADGGVAFKGPLPGRGADVIALGAAWAGVTGSARAADRLAGLPPRTDEAVIELTYTATLAPWWTVQPDLQYIRHPGFGAANPLPAAAPGSRIDDATLVALRTTVTF